MIKFIRKAFHSSVRVLYGISYPDCSFVPWPYQGLTNRELLIFLVIQKIIGINSHSKWPMHFTSKVIFPENITVLVIRGDFFA